MTDVFLPLQLTGTSEDTFATLRTVLCNDKKMVMGSGLKETMRKWSEYRANCTNMLANKSLQGTGVYCKGSFDNFACWPHSPPGIVSILCPSYLPIFTEGRTGYLYRNCTDGGTWLTIENSSEIWRNHSECAEFSHHFRPQEEEKTWQLVLRIVYTIGYSLSLSSLSLAVIILLLLRKLHCTRNFIHINLFTSFILRAVVILAKEIILYETYSKRPKDETGWIYILNSENSPFCRAVQVFMHYLIGANAFWLLVEGIFLHTLLVTPVLSEKRLLKKYMVIGWGTPIMFVVPWAVTKALYENEGCWRRNTNMGIWWIIRGPIRFSIAVNFYLFIKILKLLLWKLKAEKMTFNDYKFRLARATLVLIPLMGIHEIVFAFMPDEQIKGRYTRSFIQLTLTSFQGFLVAVLYCFANREVKTELKKRWQLYLFANHFDYRECIVGQRLRCLGKYSKRRPTHYFDHSKSHGERKRSSNVQLLQVTMRSSGNLKLQRPVGLEHFTRGSVSSSEGEGTLGETLEEILEER
ncbi:glucagon-like peptide 2 receptor isoform X2 [Lepisosteus oculatus]|uniref:glucagon-like peptide 2 receptor isoform X2 n=1 Tax=Lepisosteus oculatus TaxID=7918 RepID=UPI00371DBC83